MSESGTTKSAHSIHFLDASSTAAPNPDSAIISASLSAFPQAQVFCISMPSIFARCDRAEALVTDLSISSMKCSDEVVIKISSTAHYSIDQILFLVLGSVDMYSMLSSSCLWSNINFRISSI